MTAEDARYAFEKQYSKDDAETMLMVFDFWIEQDITYSDIEKFAQDKVKWNMKKIAITRDEKNRLIAFQYACNVKGLKDQVREIEQNIIDSYQYRK